VLKKFKKLSILQILISALITAGVSFGFSWFSNYYSQAKLIVNETGNYYKVDNTSLGYITIN